MFDVYLEAKAIDPRARSRRVQSGLVAMASCTILLAMSWTGTKLGVTRVRAPSIESLLVVMDGPPPPAAPAVPPSPSRGGAQSEASDDDPTPPVSKPSDDSLLEDVGRAAPRRGRVGAGPPSVPGVAGGPGTACLVPPCGVGRVPGTGTGVPPIAPRSPSAPASRPIESVRAHAIFSPDPPQRELVLTPTGRASRKQGKSTVAFCIDDSGKVRDVRTKHAFAGDPEVDAVCRRTVARWRFRPFMVGGRPHATCSEVTFEIRFE